MASPKARVNTAPTARPSIPVPRPSATRSTGVRATPQRPAAAIAPASKPPPVPPSKRPAQPFELRPKNKDESGIVNVRSMQATLPGIGPDDEVDSIPVDVPSSVALSPSTTRDPFQPPGTLRDPALLSPPTVREPEPTMIEEVDVSALMSVEEAPISKVPPSKAPLSKVAQPPHLRVVPPAPPSSRPAVPRIPRVELAPPTERFEAPATSHVPPPPAHVMATVADASALGVVAPRQVITPVPSPAPSFPAPSVSAPPPTAFVPQAAMDMAAQTGFAAAPTTRPSLTDPMDVLFDAAYDLCFLQSAVEGATHSMVSGVNALGAKGALVHIIDGTTGQFVTVAGHGPGADQQVLTRHEDDDWLISAALFKAKPMTMEYGGEVSGRPLPRHASLGVSRNVVVVPVLAWGRAIAVLEIVDADDMMLAGGRGENALAYLAQRLAEFLGEHEIILGVA